MTEFDLLQEMLEARQKAAQPDELLKRLADLAGQCRWRDLLDATRQAMDGPDAGTVWDDIHHYRGMAAFEVDEWEIGAHSLLWAAQQNGIAAEEAVLRFNKGIICQLRMGKLDEAEKTLFDGMGDWPEGDFSPVFEEFHRLNFSPCFQNPMEERLASLLEVPPGQEDELTAAHDWSNGLLELSLQSVSSIIRHSRFYELIMLYELCQNPALEELFDSVMMERVARWVRQEREYLRCKYSTPSFTLDEAVRVRRKIDRLAKVCRARQQWEEPDERPAWCYAAVPRLKSL